jgi:hypothetical protein
MLKSVYKSVEDIDLYVGMLHEINDVRDSVVGKTFRSFITISYLVCILKKYFSGK